MTIKYRIKTNCRIVPRRDKPDTYEEIKEMLLEGKLSQEEFRKHIFPQTLNKTYDPKL